VGPLVAVVAHSGSIPICCVEVLGKGIDPLEILGILWSPPATNQKPSLLGGLDPPSVIGMVRHTRRGLSLNQEPVRGLWLPHEPQETLPTGAFAAKIV